jgi:hypothetical protein
MMEGPGRFAYLCAAAVAIWTVEAGPHQIKRGFSNGPRDDQHRDPNSAHLLAHRLIATHPATCPSTALRRSSPRAAPFQQMWIRRCQSFSRS